MTWKDTVARLKAVVTAFIRDHHDHSEAVIAKAQDQAFGALESATDEDGARFGANRVRAFCETLRSPASVEEDWGGLLREVEAGPKKAPVKKGKK